jgi:hypothetical protein
MPRQLSLMSNFKFTTPSKADAKARGISSKRLCAIEVTLVSRTRLEDAIGGCDTHLFVQAAKRLALLLSIIALCHCFCYCFLLLNSIILSDTLSLTVSWQLSCHYQRTKLQSGSVRK